MTRSVPRDTVLRCDDCGFTTDHTTERLATYSIRKHSCDWQRELAARAERVRARRASSGPVRDCEHPRARHQHGTRPAYVFDKCRCRPCRDSAVAYEANRLRQVAYGRWTPYVDADPARAHVLELMAAGMGWKRVAAVAGVTPSIVSRLLYGKAENGSKPQPRIRAERAERILAVRFSPAPTTKVDATGTRRRLQALSTLGWSGGRLAARLGLSRANYGTMMQGSRVTARRAADVVRLYDELWQTPPPEDTARERQAVSRTRRHAAAHGWVPPLAWDDDAIDDPRARPVGVHGAQTSRREALVEDVAELVADGATVESACARLGVDRSNLQRTLQRAGRHDLWRRLTGSDPLAVPSNHERTA